jgi:alpha/beta hydrolase family protein
MDGSADAAMEAEIGPYRCALGVEIYSANEYWVKTASLLHTQPDGSADLPDSPYTRNYFMSSMQHGTGNAANRGNCQQFQNPLNSAPVQRALFLALDAWTDGTLPPASRVPRLADGTLALPADVGFPINIPDPFGETPNGKVTCTGLKTTRYRFNYGTGFYDTGIPTIFPPVITSPLEVNTPVPIVGANGPIYPSFAPTTDGDGNDIAGVRLPDVTVPLATYTGWGLRRGAQANDGCESAGQFIPFAETTAERRASGDPRPSVEERYPSFAAYQSAVHRAIDGLVKDRLMLCEDAGDQLARLIQAGLDAGVPGPHGNGEVKSTTPLCNNDKRQ